jgi:phosphoribosyl 1,2-cyclic phosphodiesterase
VKLTFLGTRGEIDLRTKAHFFHSSLLVSRGQARVIVDCGRDWLGRIGQLRPTAIVVTHAHSDHVGGLSRDVSCPVYATPECWAGMRHFPISDRRWITPGRAVRVGGIQFRAVRVEHSLRAPAVGYRINAGNVTAFYAPDVASIPDPRTALRGIRLYIGDGASITRPLIRRRGERLIGHASVRTQIAWCGAAGVPRAIVTHCGSEITRSDQAAVQRRLDQIARQCGVDVRLAYDGMTLVLR